MDPVKLRQYAAKFEELVKFCPYYNGAAANASKYIKFENGLLLEIKQGIGYQWIRRFLELVNKWRIYNEDNRAQPAHYKRHHAKECKSDEKKYFNCGRPRHLIVDCKTNVPACYNCGKPGHISTNCQKPKKVSTLNNGLVINTRTNGSLEFNHVHINCYNKSVRLLAPDDEQKARFISASQLEELLKDEAKVFAMFSSLSVESQIVVEGLPVVCEFPEVFLDDISKLPPEREAEFTIDLVPGTIHVSMAPYKMSTSEL
ncbi:uncharacterized protein LOC127131547 [Lathyrus oleraceus]|uniref:uncharacterized protein LOC127131547 n=1 Tax=Pisum sativum TaxID=3888 RepID=UPI0021D01008|nr:uncharacterized protein LOC127131547 [Pisum sativum]